jgi:hypothetical protein
MITKADRELYPHHTDGAILGLKLVGGLTDDALQLWCEDATTQHPIFLALMTLMTAGDHVTNTNWLRARLAYEAYDRGMIDEFEVDRLAA